MIEVLSPGINKGGRPRKQILLESVEKLAAIGCTTEEMGWVLGTTKKTIIRRLAEPEFRDAIERGKSLGRQSLRHKQMQAALAGNPTMLIWMGKQMLGQKDQQHITVVPATVEEWYAALTPEQREIEKARLEIEAAREVTPGTVQ